MTVLDLYHYVPDAVMNVPKGPQHAYLCGAGHLSRKSQTGAHPYRRVCLWRPLRTDGGIWHGRPDARVKSCTKIAKPLAVVPPEVWAAWLVGGPAAVQPLAAKANRVWGWRAA